MNPSQLLQLRFILTLVAISAGSAALYLLTGIYYEQPTWTLRLGLRAFSLCLAVAFLASSLLGLSPVFRSDKTISAVMRILAVGALGLLPLATGMIVYDVDVSQRVTIYQFAGFFALLALGCSLIPVGIRVLGNSSVLILVLFVHPPFAKHIAWDDSISYVMSSLYDLQINNHNVALRTNANGGAIDMFDEQRILVVTADGHILVVSFSDENAAAIPMGLSVPINRMQYLAESKHRSHSFRVTDALVHQTDAGETIVYATHHFWHSDQRCVTLRLSSSRISLTPTDTSPEEWTRRFDTSPCLGEDIKFGNTNGGRLAKLTNTSLLMSVGDHDQLHLVDNDASSYGKILEISTLNWDTKIFTRGHRNPQGLFVDANEVWETEHGPMGGDELNRLVDNKHYGWPQATYGTDYGKKTWSLADTPGIHASGTRPVFAWVPSIGISNLIKIRGERFPLWTGDWMVGSLAGLGNGYSLYRVRVQDQIVVVVERIWTGRGIRDLLEMPDGRLAMWNGTDVIQIVQPGEYVFSECAACHPIRRQNHGIGPDLWGVVNSRVGRHRDYQYSEALRSFGGFWTRERLDGFLANPEGMVPGTTMDFAGIQNADRRRSIIEYLEKLRR